MKDVDPSARLHVTPSGDDVVLEASLGDSRIARRKVHSADDLFTMVEALTVVIPSEKPAVHEPAAAPAVNVAPPAPKQRVEPTPAPPSNQRDLGVELGLALEARLSGSPSYLSAGGALYASVRPGKWFFGLTARWQPSEVPASGPQPGFEMESAGAGFIVGRRVVETRTVGLDAGASTLVLVDTQSTESRVPDEVGSATAVRFGLLLRALFGRSHWRFAPSIDADVAPTRLRHDIRIDPSLPPLPAWSVALALGASWVEP